MSIRFFAFRPRGLRRALLGAAVLAVALSAWALSAGLRGLERFGTVRAAVLGGLAVGFGIGWLLLRPRPDFGIRLDAAGIEVSRPWGASSLHIPWTYVRRTRLERRPWRRVVIELRPKGQVLIAEPLVGSRATFQDLLQALQDRSPGDRGDA